MLKINITPTASSSNNGSANKHELAKVLLQHEPLKGYDESSHIEW